MREFSCLKSSAKLPGNSLRRDCLHPRMGPKEKSPRPGVRMGSAKRLPAPLCSSDSATRAGGAGRWVFSTRECFNLLIYFPILFFKRKK